MTSARRLAYNGRPTAAAPTASWVTSVVEGGYPGGGNVPRKAFFGQRHNCAKQLLFSFLNYLFIAL